MPHVPNVYYSPNIGAITDTNMHSKYRVLLGTFIWINMQWRMDIDFIVNHLSSFVANPSVEHFNAALRILGYLRKTARWGMVYIRSKITTVSTFTPVLLIFSDANWGGDYDSKSISCYIISVCTAEEILNVINNSIYPPGNAITWSSRRQRSFVADSTEAAETFCMVEASKVNAWLRIKLEDSGAFQVKPKPFAQ